MNDAIVALFRKRDEAVRKQDPIAFLATQLSELRTGSSEDYLSIADMTTDVLFIHEETDGTHVVFAKETYRPSDKYPHAAFATYFLVETVKGWKIHRSK